ncbi:TOBE domain-containing protein [Castellaniella hirudinis]|uniref:TOBE domain-containing protein n=1 Tax=Castellaniella hirudinis TaxID=1144617 RepID=UPI0039C14CFC
MKTSARNFFSGVVTDLQRGVVNDAVSIQLAGGQQLHAIITCGSAQTLALKTGGEVFALVKSSSVILVAEDGPTRFSARNCLSGRITRLETGAVNTEVVLDSDGLTLAAIITNESAQNLGLAVGTSVKAIFKASSVIVGVAG